MFRDLFVYAVIILSSFWIYFRLKNRKIFELIKNYSTIDSYPLIGSAHLFIGKRQEGLLACLGIL